MRLSRKFVRDFKVIPKRDIFDPKYTPLKPKFQKTDHKERMRIRKREKLMNQYDPELTGELVLPTLTTAKCKAMYKYFNLYKNVHRFTRKLPPKPEMAEFIKKSKEYSDYRTWKFEKMNRMDVNFLTAEYECARSLYYLPNYLVSETADPFLEDEYEWIHGDEDVLEREKELDNYYLYLDQVMRILPDDFHAILKTTINTNSYYREGEDEEGFFGLRADNSSQGSEAS